MQQTPREKAQVQEQCQKFENAMKPASCEGCVKKDVCKVLQCVTAMLSPPNFGENRPFEPTDIGKICHSYASATLYKTLTLE